MWSNRPDTTAPLASETLPDTVEVILEDYVINMPGVLPAGRTVLRLANRGLEEVGPR